MTVASPRRFAPPVVWIARLAWLLVALLGGAAIDGALEDRSSSVTWVAAVGGWTIWALVALALAIPSVPSLTVVRVGAPLAAAVTVAAATAGAAGADLLLLGVPAFVAIASVLTPELALRFVQASAYGDEQRFPLRAPAAAGAAAIVTWLFWAPLPIIGPFLLAAGSWVLGTIVTVAAVLAGIYLVPRWHRLSLRWLVLVPAGLVVRDPVVLADTLMLPSAQIASIALAPADTEAADLTGPASGYALEVATTSAVTAVYAFTPSAPNGTAIHMTAFLVSPSRPGRTLEAAAARGLPVA